MKPKPPRDWLPSRPPPTDDEASAIFQQMSTTVIVAQVAGGVIGLLLTPHDGGRSYFGHGLLLVTFPAIALWACVQHLSWPGSLQPLLKPLRWVFGVGLLLSAAGVLSLAQDPASWLFDKEDARVQSMARTSREILSAAGVSDDRPCRIGRPPDQYRRANPIPIYICPVPERARDALRSALVAAQWQSTNIASYALFSYERPGEAAHFVCPFRSGRCEFWVEYRGSR